MRVAVGYPGRARSAADIAITRDIVDATSKTVQELQRLNLSAGVDIEIKL